MNTFFKSGLLLLSLLLINACSEAEQSAQNESSANFNQEQLIEDLRVLSADEMEGRRTGTVGNRLAREYLVQRFMETGAEPFQGSYMHEFEVQNRSEDVLTGVNVVALVEGSADTDSVIVITAHYDHLGIRDSLIYNGADDDASGTAALLAYADYFNSNTPNHDLVFAAFDAEEMGLQGAKAFVQDLAFLSTVKMNINLDMISQNEDGELYASGTYHYPRFKPVLEAIETGGVQLLFGHDRPEQGYDDWTNASDHSAFHELGVPFIYFGVEDHEHYHQPTDDFETIPQDFYVASARVILNAIKAFDQLNSGSN